MDNPDMTAVPLRVHLLGTFRVWRGSEEIAPEAWRGKQPSCHLFKYLAAIPQHRATRNQVGRDLWPDSIRAPQDRSKTSLSFLRKILEPDLAAGSESHYIQTEGNAIMLAGVAFVDSHAFAALAKLRNEDEVQPERLEEALALYQGHFLADDDDPDDPGMAWIREQRARMYTTFVSLALRYAGLRATQGMPERAILPLQKAVSGDVLWYGWEAAQRGLMALWWKMGEPREALRQFERCKRALRAATRDEPEPETLDLYQRISAEQAAMAPAVPATIPTSDLIGREDDLRRLAAAYAEVKSRRGRAILLTGEDGSGKTALAEALIDRLAEEDVPALTGSCSAHGEQRPYGPFVMALGAYLQLLPRSVVQGLVRPVAGALHPMLPELVPVSREAPALTTAAFCEAMGSVLAAIGTPDPAVLVLDDLQWADEPTITLLRHVLHRLSRERLLVIMTCDDAHLDPDHPLARLLDEPDIRDLTQRWAVTPLQPDHVRELVERLSHQRSLDPRLLALIHRETGGNPYFVDAVVRALLESGRLAAARTEVALEQPIPLPGDVHAMISQRLRRLSPAARTVLDVMALIGHDVEYPLLCLVEALREVPLRAALDEAAKAHMVMRQDSGYRFQHDLVRQTLVAELNAMRRDNYHQSIGLALEQRAGEQPDDVAEDLARHFNMTEDHERAVRYLTLAGDKARTLHAPGAALAAYQQALAHAEAVREPARTTWLARLHLEMGRILDVRGDGPAALAHTEAGLWQADRGADQGLAADLWEVRSGLLIKKNELREAGECIEKSRILREELRDERGLANVHSIVGNIAWKEQRWDDAIAAYERSFAIRKELRDERAICNSLFNLGNAYRERGNIEVDDGVRAETFYKACLASAEHLDFQERIAYVSINLAEFAIEHGAWDEAERYLERALEIGRQVDDAVILLCGHLAMGRLRCLQGQQPAALAALDLATAQITGSAFPDERRAADYWYSEAYLGMGHLDLAGDHAQRVIDRSILPDGSTCRARSVLGRIAAQRHDLDAAERHLLAARSQAAALGHAYTLALTLADGGLVLWRHAPHRRAEARALLEEALAMCTALRAGEDMKRIARALADGTAPG